MSIKKLIISILFLLPAISLAENSTAIEGGFTVHHNAFLTSELSPEIAKAYNIRRSNNRAMLNVSIIKEKAGTTGTPMTAEVKVKASNLRGQVRTVPMQEIVETHAVYYIGTFLVENLETVNFDIKVKPEGTTNAQAASLKQQFFTK